MTYQLYIKPHCKSCERVTQYITHHKISVELITISPDNPKKLTFPIMVFPALMASGKLLAYGDDIIRYFNKKEK